MIVYFLAMNSKRCINASLRQSKVLDAWKAAQVIPLFKKGKVEDVNNYRPISILSAASKLLEKAVHVQLCAFLCENKILSPYQYGFLKLHSTESPALPFADTIRRNIHQGYMTGAVFIYNRTTRQSNTFHLPGVRKKIAKGSLYYNGCKIFNRLNSQCNYTYPLVIVYF